MTRREYVNIGRVDDPAWATLTAFLAGWVIGWLLLWRTRPLPTPEAHSPGTGLVRRPVSIVVPARDEAAALPALLEPLRGQLGDEDEMIVVDDHSADDTADVARRLGARVLVAGEPPVGWLGKPNACRHGAAHAGGEILVFLDADVRPGPDLVDRVVHAIDETPDALVSVQPWHTPGRLTEQLSMFCNIVALMGAGRFSVFGRRVEPRVAFGPVLALRRELYERIGGHAHPDVRGAHTEDIALARLAARVELFTGRPSVAFRMYPDGLPALVEGWTRSIASGAAAAPRWAVVTTVGWVWAIAAAPFVAWWAYGLAVVQCAVLARRAGRFSPVLAVVYPVALAVLVVVVVRSAWHTVRRDDVVWKRRRVPTR